MIVITIDYERIRLPELIRSCNFGWVMSKAGEKNPPAYVAGKFTLLGRGRLRFATAAVPVRQSGSIQSPWRLGCIEHLLVFYLGSKRECPEREVRYLVALGGTGTAVPWICHSRGRRESLVYEEPTHQFDPRFRALCVRPFMGGTDS